MTHSHVQTRPGTRWAIDNDCRLEEEINNLGNRIEILFTIIVVYYYH